MDKTFSPSYFSSQIIYVEAEAVDFSRFRFRFRFHISAFNTKKSALSQHVMDFNPRKDWNNVKILKSESQAHRRRVVKSFLINQKSHSLNVINHNGANFPAVYIVFTTNI